uniref:Solute carrier organic anion transporter family member n=1 Tax=Angiostrongylus costaricensis TaxID=334426 RepID=A0A158PJS0_ANGCS
LFRSHSRQASQGVPYRSVEKPRRIRDEKQNEIIEMEMSVLVKESQCGIGRWRPTWLSFLGSRKWMIILLCWYCAVQGIVVNGLVPSAISSIERRFKLSTSTMGRIVQFYDFGYVLFCIPVSYFGGRHSKPSVLGAGLALIAFGSILFSTPHMLADSYSATQDNKSFGSCSTKALWNFSDANPGTFRFVFLFCVAHFLHGIGATPLFTIGVSYIDENVGKALSSLFVGIFYSFAVFGPAAGFLTASTFLKYHTDFWHLPAEQILRVSGDETDPSWVGAWWIGFVIASLVAMTAVVPIVCLPKVLPESLKWHRNRLVEAIQAGRRRTPECCGLPGTNKTGALYQDAPLQGKSFNLPYSHQCPIHAHNPCNVLTLFFFSHFSVMNMDLSGLVITGASSFMSKYLERQFNVPPSRSSLLIGCIMVPMAGVGCMISGFIVQYFRLNCVTTLKLSVGLLFLSLLLTPMYLIYCPHDPLVGVETTYPDRDGQISVGNYSDIEPSLRSTCNSHCLCSEAEFRPVCAEFLDGRQLSYYSPCFAGCSEPYTPMQKVYSNCSCVVETSRLHVRQVKKGLCESKCKGLLGFLIIFAPLSLCTFAVGVPIISVILRTVDYNDRSFALGIQGILVRVIGTIPAPVLFGWMFDVSCIRYQSELCGDSESGSCLLYSNKLLADLFLTFSIIGQALAMGILTTVLMVYGGTLQDDPLLDVPLEEVRHDEDVDLSPHETALPLLQ